MTRSVFSGSEASEAGIGEERIEHEAGEHGGMLDDAGQDAVSRE